jgi:hypothetical protein
MIDEQPWRKSSYSGAQASCVEVADSADVVLVRDTANRDGGALVFAPGAWKAFTASLKR